MLAWALLAAWSGDACTVVPACHSAGKSMLVTLLAGALANRVGLRVAMAAQTREQAAELALRITAVSHRASLIVSGPVKSRSRRTVFAASQAAACGGNTRRVAKS
jgi:hypothetical protein